MSAVISPTRRFTVTRRDGHVKTVESCLTDAAAASVCEKLQSTFAKDLARQLMAGRRLSVSQQAWMHVIAVEATTPKPSPQIEAVVSDDGQMDRILEMFRKASEHLKFPKFAVRLADGQAVILSPSAKDADTLYVKLGEMYLGKIASDGIFFPSQACKNMGVVRDVSDAILRFASDPVGEASKYGRLTGNCCFCRKGLTDERSTSVGYGPICAGHYGLPWGEK